MPATASLITLMCVRTALTAGIPGFKDFAGSPQAAELTHKLLLHTAGTLGTLKLPKDNPQEKAGRACLSAAAMLARQGMRWEMGDRTPYLQLLLKGWREGTLSTMPLVEARQLPGEPWLKAYTKLVRNPDHWEDFGVPWTAAPATAGPADDSPRSLFDQKADPQTADVLDRALLGWTAESLKEHGPPPACWETGLRDGFLTEQDGDERVRFYQAWCVFLRDKLRTTPALATDFFGRALLFITQQLPLPESPPAPSTSPPTPSVASGLPPLTPDQQQEFIGRCTQLLQDHLAQDAGSLMQKAEEILQQLDRIEQTIQTADQGSQQRDQLSHAKLEQQSGQLQKVNSDIQQILALLQKPAHAIEAVNEARTQAGPQASLEEVQTQAAAALGLSAESLKKELQNENADTDDVLRQIEATKQRLAPALDALDEAHRLALTRKADAEYALGHWRAAEPLYRQAQGLTNKTTNWQVWAAQTWKLSGVLKDLQLHEEAETLIRELLIQYSFRNGANSSSVVLLTNNLANVLHKQGKWDEAEILYRRVLEVMELSIGPNTTLGFTVVNNLANLLRERGDLSEAKVLLRRVLGMREQTLGADDHRTLNSLNNLANLMCDLGDFSEAEGLLRRASSSMEKTLGKEHPYTLTAFNNLAISLVKQDLIEEAESIYQRVLRIREGCLGSEHPDTLKSIHDLACLFHTQGRREQAEQLYRRALKGMTKVMGSEHLNTLGCGLNLATFLSENGNQDEAETLYREGLELMKRALGSQHPATLCIYHGLGLLLADKKEFPEALVLMTHAVEGRSGKFGLLHPITIQSQIEVENIKRRASQPK